MQTGGATFVKKTGIVGFDPAALSLTVVPPLSFGPWYRPCLMHRYPTEDLGVRPDLDERVRGARWIASLRSPTNPTLSTMNAERSSPMIRPSVWGF